MKTILLTGATDGIGLLTATKLAKLGHHIILHGRNEEKLLNVKDTLNNEFPNITIDTINADLSDLSQVKLMSEKIKERFKSIDVLINNAGILKSNTETTIDGFDIRMAVNFLAPVLLTHNILPVLSKNAVIVNLSSAAQASVDLSALCGEKKLDYFQAYAQSKLAITLWTKYLASKLKDNQTTVSVNPASMLGSKMVKEGFGVAGKDLSIGANILVQASLDENFKQHNGEYFDNDSQMFSNAHLDFSNDATIEDLMKTTFKLLNISQ